MASSAPIQALVDFQQYFDVVTNALATTGAYCNKNIGAATKMLATLIETEEGRTNLSKTFKYVKFDHINISAIFLFL